MLSSVKGVFLKKKFKGTLNLYIQTEKENILVGTFYEEWHAIKTRMLFRSVYGLCPTKLSKEDAINDMPIKKRKELERVHQLNLHSKVKIVRQHEEAKELAGNLLRA